MIKVWADFNANSENGLYLNCKGTIDDLARQKIELKDGMELILWNEDLDDNNNADNLIVQAVAKYNNKLKIWEGIFEWEKIRRESDFNK